MNVFSVNQVNQVYVVPNGASVLPQDGETIADLAAATEGSVFVGSIENGVYVAHKGKGGITRTDLIENVMWAKKTPAINDALLLPAYKIGFISPKDVDDFRGQSLRLTMSFDGFIGISPEDSTYWKYGDVKVGSAMTANEFWVALARCIALNMRNEATQFLKVFVVDENNVATEITATTSKTALAALTAVGADAINNIVIKMTEPEWIPGLKQQRVMRVTFSFNAVDTGAGEEIWGESKLVPVASNAVTTNHDVAESTLATNGKIAADYEYFFHGERGDQRRLVGYPNVVITKYMADPTKEYDFVQIHYAYIGSNESVQKSEKDVTFLVENGATNTVGKLLTALGNEGITITAVEPKSWIKATGGETNADDNNS